eukprot:2063737-Pyramimonas_sp.AAC.4
MDSSWYGDSSVHPSDPPAPLCSANHSSLSRNAARISSATCMQSADPGRGMYPTKAFRPAFSASIIHSILPAHGVLSIHSRTACAWGVTHTLYTYTPTDRGSRHHSTDRVDFAMLPFQPGAEPFRGRQAGGGLSLIHI